MGGKLYNLRLKQHGLS